MRVGMGEEVTGVGEEEINIVGPSHSEMVQGEVGR